jgi:hypothetical protein
MEPRKMFAFLCLSFALFIVAFLVTQRIVPDVFILVEMGLAASVMLLSINLLSHKLNRPKE